MESPSASALLLASEAPAFAASEEKAFESFDDAWRLMAEEEEEEDRISFSFVLEIITRLRLGIVRLEDLKRGSEGGAEGRAKLLKEIL